MQQKTRILIGLTLSAIYLAVFFSVKVFGDTSSQLQVSFLDIGQGDAMYIRAPNGNDMLIDGSRSNALLIKKLKNAMSAGDTSIDVVLETHPDADHIGGLPYVIEHYSVGEFVEPGVASGSKLYATLLTDVANKKVPHVLARTGMKIILDEEKNIAFTVLSPSNVYEGEDTNDASIVGILSYGNRKFMFTGDAGIPTEQEILAAQSDVNKTIATETNTKNNSIFKNISVDVLKLGHHGSRTSSSEAFLEAVHPNTAIISAGCDNSYGHPHKEIVDRIAMLKIISVATCNSGTITFYTDGNVLSRKTEK